MKPSGLILCFTLPISTILSLIVAPTTMSYGSVAQAQPPLQRLAKRPQNASNSSRSGGVRGECLMGTEDLRVLMPENDPGLTTQGHPTFWFYLPIGKQSLSSKARSPVPSTTFLEFLILDEANQPALTEPIRIPLPNQPGIVHLTIPSTEQALEVGKDYNWFFSIVCNDHDFSANPTVSGWLSRIQPSQKLIQRLKSLRSQDKYLAYKENHLWFEYLSQLADYRTVQTTAWKNLLALFSLQGLVQAPLVEIKPEIPKNAAENRLEG